MKKSFNIYWQSVSKFADLGKELDQLCTTILQSKYTVYYMHITDKTKLTINPIGRFIYMQSLSKLQMRYAKEIKPSISPLISVSTKINKCLVIKF